MRILIILAIVLGAGISNIFTRPLLFKKMGQYSLFALNMMIGCILSYIFLYVIFELKEEEAQSLIPWFLVVLVILVSINKYLPGGEENLKTWYEEPSDEDDKEYFSKRDMKNKPWWKFMFFPGWISLIFFNLMLVFGLLFWLWYGDNLIFKVSLLADILISPIIVWNAVKRKRDYDRGYK